MEKILINLYIGRQEFCQSSLCYFWLCSLIIAGPAFLIGILFIINWLKKRNAQKETGSNVVHGAGAKS